MLGNSFRHALINVVAAVNLLIGAGYVAYGVWILSAGAEAIQTVFQVTEQLGRNAGPAGGIGLNVAAKGIAGLLMDMLRVVAAILIVCGTPHLFIGLGMLIRRRWARILGLLLGFLGLLAGIGLLVASQGATYPLVSGIVFGIYGLLSFVALFGWKARYVYCHRELFRKAPYDRIGGLLAACIATASAVVGLMVFCIRVLFYNKPQ